MALLPPRRGKGLQPHSFCSEHGENPKAETIRNDNYKVLIVEALWSVQSTGLCHFQHVFLLPKCSPKTLLTGLLPQAQSGTSMPSCQERSGHDQNQPPFCLKASRKPTASETGQLSPPAPGGCPAQVAHEHRKASEHTGVIC